LNVTGIRDGQNVDYERLSRSYLPLPPEDEQEAIGHFLTWANGRLERAIRAKRKVIALLNEQKQAIIHRAVTLGLDDSVSLKHAGVDGAADVPQHWDVLALKRVLRRLIDCEHKTAPHVDRSEFRVARTSAVRRGLLQLQGTYCTTESAFRAWTRRGQPEPGDVIFTREAPAGEACLVPNDLQLCLGQRTVLMKVRKERLNPQFLIHTIYAGPPRSAISRASQGSTVGHFNVSDIGALTILVPPIAEQRSIVSAVTQQTAGIDTAMRRLEREIDLLREHGTCLIADVVTGQLDAREAATRLPAEVNDGEEDEPSDDTEALEEEAPA
jgi:type I restriction enzyme S subunit